MALVMTMLSRKPGFLSSLAILTTFEFLLDSFPFLVFHLHSDICALPLHVNWISLKHSCLASYNISALSES